MEKRYIVYTAILLLLIFIVALLILPFPFSSLFSSDERLFYVLIANRKDSEKAKKIAEMLLDSDAAITLSANDIDIYGGATRGWSEWILINTSKRAKVQIELERIVIDKSSNIYKKLEALFILWHITRDKKYLVTIFNIVRKAEGVNIGLARERLAKIFHKNPDFETKINKNYQYDIDLSEEEFINGLDLHMQKLNFADEGNRK